ncbi:MAG: extracellular solute-binding protein, partial [Burkholderiales bacterium]|nr:extracellular solute-binding protein [Anaerolineae bacterium]
YRQQLTAWGGVTYALPFSGDALLLNYRKDLVNPQSPYAADFRSEYGYTLDEPTTWDQYHEIAAFFNRREVETSGVIAPTFGAAEAQAPNAQATASLIARAASFTKWPGDPCFFFSCDPDSPMQPNINNTGWVHALADMGDIQNYSSPAITSFGVEQVRAALTGGSAVLALDWPDLGILSVEENESLVQNAVGFGLIPGGDFVWNTDAGEWVEAQGGVNYAPFIASGGWLISVSADSAVQEAALDFAAFMANEELSFRLATTGGTGVNPFRSSQLDDAALWERECFDAESAADYIDAITATLNHPNAVVDLRIPGAVEYMAALDAEISRALSGEIDAEIALDNAAAAWDAITERYGRDEQFEAYQASLNIE